MVELTQGEIIQIFRKRVGINQSQLGAEAFNTTPDSGRTKIKNIELNKQKPTIDDLKAIADSLNMPLADLLFYQSEHSSDKSKQQPMVQPDCTSADKTSDAVSVHHRIFDHFKGLEECLSILNKALILEDQELISYVATKAAGILQKAHKAKNRLQSK